MGTPHKSIAQHKGRSPKSSGPNSCGRPYEPDLRISSVVDAQAAWDAHKAKRPDPGTVGYAEWLETKTKLETALDMAKGADCNKWKAVAA